MSSVNLARLLMQNKKAMGQIAHLRNISWQLTSLIKEKEGRETKNCYLPFEKKNCGLFLFM